MRRNDDGNGHRRVRFALPLVVLTMGALLTAGAAKAQTDTGQAGQPETNAAQQTYETVYLSHATDARQAEEIVTVLRNMLQRARIVFVASENAIAMRGTAEDLAAAHKFLAELDRPSQSWKLTYTVSGADGTPPAASHSYVLTIAAGRTADLKEGKRVPLVTGNTAQGATGTQVQYVDIGLAINADVDGGGDALRVRTKIEQTAIAEEKSGLGAQDPVISQARLENTVILVPGKPTVLGSLEMAGSGQRQQVSVVAEALP